MCPMSIPYNKQGMGLMVHNQIILSCIYTAKYTHITAEVRILNYFCSK